MALLATCENKSLLTPEAMLKLLISVDGGGNLFVGPYTAPLDIVDGVDIGAVDNTWIDQGEEIDVDGYRSLGIWVELTVNNSTGNQLQILSKHAAGVASEEYVLEVAAEYQKVLGNNNIFIFYEFELNDLIKYVQIQTMATLVGAIEGVVSITVTRGH